MQRRSFIGGGLAAASLSGAASRTRAAEKGGAPEPGPGPFDLSTVRNLARNLAARPFRAPDTRLPAAVAHLDFDAYRGIRYRKDRALWAGQHGRFTAEFLPRGFLFAEEVSMFTVANGQATPVPYDPDVFDYPDPRLKVPDALGYSGFRIHYPLNRQDYFDEVCVFQGASYFRAVARGQTYGLSARGLAIGTGDPKGEEFARFRAFWLEQPGPDADAVVVHALLDSPSTTGAYRFTIRPGQETVFDTECTLYPRVDIAEAGIAPLTGMFLFDAENRHQFDDWRPAAHDSGGLALWTGAGEQIWRPLNDPVNLQFSAFVDTNPRGFGLMQRKRRFADYQDLALSYEKRPSLFIEPVGAWDTGAVDLVEIPSISEVNDNMVAFWRPRDKLAAHGEYGFTYRMHWCWTDPLPTALGRATDTRIGAGPDRGRTVMIDFVGDLVRSPDLHPTADLGIDKGSIRNVSIGPNPETGGWRVLFEFVAGRETVVEMHGRLMNGTTPLTETWIYRWTAA